MSLGPLPDINAHRSLTTDYPPTDDTKKRTHRSKTAKAASKIASTLLSKGGNTLPMIGKAHWQKVTITFDPNKTFE